MIIKQCYMSLGMKKKFIGFYKRHNLVPYSDHNYPSFFYGIYTKEDFNVLSKHVSLAVIIWRGSDILHYTPQQIRSMTRSNVRHIVISSHLINDLVSANIKPSCYKFIPLVGADITGIDVEPLGNEVYAYVPNTEKKRLFYNAKIVESIAQKIPFKINIATSSDLWTKQQLIEIYKRCFIGLRLSIHDGIANQVVEMGLMGRRVVHNNRHPNAIPWNCEQDVLDAIENESALIGQKNEEIANQVRRYITVKPDWLRTRYWGWK